MKENSLEAVPTIQQLYEAGAHFGHLRSRSDARSKDFVFTFRNRVAVIDLNKTRESLDKALEFIVKSAQDGLQFVFVGTKMQAREEIKALTEELKLPYIVERWPGGLLTNFEVVEKSIKKMLKTEKDLSENKLDYLKKKERVRIDKNLEKAKKIFGGLREMAKKPDVLIVVDAKEESVAIQEARKAKVAVVALCDTNSNPKIIDYPIVANDDSRSTIKMILKLIGETIKQNQKKAPVESSDVEERMEKVLGRPETKEKTGEKPAVKAVAKSLRTRTKTAGKTARGGK